MDEKMPEKSRLCSDSSVIPEMNNNDTEIPAPVENWRLLSCGGRLRIRNHTARECFAEFVGTFILTVFVFSGGMQAGLTQGKFGNTISASVGAGIGVFLGIQCGVGISGGHINPIISLLFLLRGDLKWWKFPLYAITQHVGSFCAAAIVYGVFKDFILDFEGETMMMWASYPRGPTTLVSAICQQVLAAGLLAFGVAALADPHNNPIPLASVGPLVGALVTGIGCVLTLPSTGILNPALDLAPRLFSYTLGYGDETFSFNSWTWIWVPIFGPYAGCFIGVFSYYLLIGNHMPTAYPKFSTRKDNSI